MIKLVLLLWFVFPSSLYDKPAVVGKTRTVVAGKINSDFNVNQDVLIQLINDVRQKGCRCGGTKMRPVPEISWNDQLAKAAYDHSVDMNKKKYFGHNSPKGSTPGDRVRSAGYSWKAVGENIAFNYPDERAVVAGWLKSVSHCKTIMSPDFRETGAGRAGPYWTQDFGKR